MKPIKSTSHRAPDSPLLNDEQIIERLFNHIDNGTTDLGDTIWREPVEHYHSQERFNAYP